LRSGRGHWHRCAPTSNSTSVSVVLRLGLLIPPLVLASCGPLLGSGAGLTPSAVGPPARVDHAMAYDTANQVVVLFGGNANPSWDPRHAWLGDTWLWNGSSWIGVSPDHTPGGRGAMAMAYDAATRQTVLFGGIRTTGVFPTSSDHILGDTWIWNGTDWGEVRPMHKPPARARAAMEFDPATSNVVMFGGSGETGLLSDTWLWEGTDWREGPPTQSAPPVGAMLVHAGLPDRLTTIGSCAHDDRTSAQRVFTSAGWAPTLTPHPLISARCSPAVASDSYSHVALIFGGTLGFPDSVGSGPTSDTRLDDTWLWDGRSWQPVSPASQPAGRVLSRAAYDQARDRVVLFGGDGGPAGAVLGDTWLWNGAQWERAA